MFDEFLKKQPNSQVWEEWTSWSWAGKRSAQAGIVLNQRGGQFGNDLAQLNLMAIANADDQIWLEIFEKSAFFRFAHFSKIGIRLEALGVSLNGGARSKNVFRLYYIPTTFIHFLCFILYLLYFPGRVGGWVAGWLVGWFGGLLE